MRANSNEVVYGTERANYSPFFDDDMAAQSCGIGKDDVAPDYAIMRNVGVGHDQGMAANARQPSALGGAAIDGDKFADDIVVADLEASRLAAVAQVLRGKSD